MHSLALPDDPAMFFFSNETVSLQLCHSTLSTWTRAPYHCLPVGRFPFPHIIVAVWIIKPAHQHRPEFGPAQAVQARRCRPFAITV
jgi:hypothetical protein